MTFAIFNSPYIGIEKGPIHCWVISIGRLSPIWLSVITKGNRAHLFWPKKMYLIMFWPFIEPYGHQQC